MAFAPVLKAVQPQVYHTTTIDYRIHSEKVGNPKRSPDTRKKVQHPSWWTCFKQTGSNRKTGLQKLHYPCTLKALCCGSQRQRPPKRGTDRKHERSPESDPSTTLSWDHSRCVASVTVEALETALHADLPGSHTHGRPALECLPDLQN
jgi:hypothetical protein